MPRPPGSSSGRGGTCTGCSNTDVSDTAHGGHSSSAVNSLHNSAHRVRERVPCAYCVAGAKACSIAPARMCSTSEGSAFRRPAAVRAALLGAVEAAVLLRRVSHRVPVSFVDAAGHLRLGLAAAGMLNPCLVKRIRTHSNSHVGRGREARGDDRGRRHN